MIDPKNKNLLEKYIRSLESKNLSPNTIEGSKKILNLFLKYINKKLLRDITDFDIKDWQINLMNNEKSNSTIRRYSKIVNNLLEFLNINVIIEYPKIKQKKDVKFFKENEIKIIYENLINSREKAMISLFLETGLKTSELVNLKKKNLIENSIILTPIEPYRVINLNQKAQFYLAEYLNSQEYLQNENFIFNSQGNKNNPLSFSLINFIFKKITKKINTITKLSFQITPQILRNTFIYSQLKKGVPINLIKIQLGLRSSYLISKIKSKSSQDNIESTDILIKCTKCGSDILPHMKICPHCFNNLSNFVCGNCNKTIYIDYSFCPYCGIDLKK